MPTIRHYFSSPAPIHRFFEGLSPSPVLIVMLTKALFRWQMTRSGSSPLSCPPLSRESRPGLAVTVTPSHTERRGTKRQASLRAFVRVYFGFNDFGRVDVLWKTGFAPTTSVRNSAISASPRSKGGRQRWRQWRHRNRYETETLRHIRTLSEGKYMD